MNRAAAARRMLLVGRRRTLPPRQSPPRGIPVITTMTTTTAGPIGTATATATPARFFSSNGKPQPSRVVSREERARLRAARRERAAQTIAATQGGAGNAATSEAGAVAGATTTTAVVGRGSASTSKLAWYAGFGIPTLLLGWGLYDADSPPAKFAKMIGLTSYVDSVGDQFARPARDTLLPDWAQMPNVPQDIPVPHTLVIDLENTLVSSSWDRRYGWRHAKRPGVDKFLQTLSQYYEIVLYSPSHEGIAGPVVDSLDKHGCIMHRLYRDATYYRDGVHCKDLSKLNRNVNRIVAIDDDPKALSLNPGNLICVKPYDDPHDREDDTLERITPLLIEIAREGYDDVPSVLNQFVTEVSDDDTDDKLGLVLGGGGAEGGALRRGTLRRMDADEMAKEYEDRIGRMREERVRRARSGLGALASRPGENRPAPELPPPEVDAVTAPAGQLTAKDVVGAAPSPDELDLDGEGGGGRGLRGWLDRRRKEQEEEQVRKMEKWNEVMMRKQLARKEAAEAAESAERQQQQGATAAA